MEKNDYVEEVTENVLKEEKEKDDNVLIYTKKDFLYAYIELILNGKGLGEDHDIPLCSNKFRMQDIMQKTRGNGEYGNENGEEEVVDEENVEGCDNENKYERYYMERGGGGIAGAGSFDNENERERNKNRNDFFNWDNNINRNNIEESFDSNNPLNNFNRRNGYPLKNPKFNKFIDPNSSVPNINSGGGGGYANTGQFDGNSNAVHRNNFGRKGSLLTEPGGVPNGTSNALNNNTLNSNNKKLVWRDCDKGVSSWRFAKGNNIGNNIGNNVGSNIGNNVVNVGAHSGNIGIMGSAGGLGGIGRNDQKQRGNRSFNKGFHSDAKTVAASDTHNVQEEGELSNDMVRSIYRNSNPHHSRDRNMMHMKREDFFNDNSYGNKNVNNHANNNYNNSNYSNNNGLLPLNPMAHHGSTDNNDVINNALDNLKRSAENYNIGHYTNTQNKNANLLNNTSPFFNKANTTMTGKKPGDIHNGSSVGGFPFSHQGTSGSSNLEDWKMKKFKRFGNNNSSDVGRMVEDKYKRESRNELSSVFTNKNNDGNKMNVNAVNAVNSVNTVNAVNAVNAMHDKNYYHHYGQQQVTGKGEHISGNIGGNQLHGGGSYQRGGGNDEVGNINKNNVNDNADVASSSINRKGGRLGNMEASYETLRNQQNNNANSSNALFNTNKNTRINEKRNSKNEKIVEEDDWSSIRKKTSLADSKKATDDFMWHKMSEQFDKNNRMSLDSMENKMGNLCNMNSLISDGISNTLNKNRNNPDMSNNDVVKNDKDGGNKNKVSNNNVVISNKTKKSNEASFNNTVNNGNTLKHNEIQKTNKAIFPPSKEFPTGANGKTEEKNNYGCASGKVNTEKNKKKKKKKSDKEKEKEKEKDILADVQGNVMADGEQNRKLKTSLEKSNPKETSNDNNSVKIYDHASVKLHINENNMNHNNNNIDRNNVNSVNNNINNDIYTNRNTFKEKKEITLNKLYDTDKINLQGEHGAVDKRTVGESKLSDAGHLLVSGRSGTPGEITGSTGSTGSGTNGGNISGIHNGSDRKNLVWDRCTGAKTSAPFPKKNLGESYDMPNRNSRFDSLRGKKYADDRNSMVDIPQESLLQKIKKKSIHAEISGNHFFSNHMHSTTTKESSGVGRSNLGSSNLRSTNVEIRDDNTTGNRIFDQSPANVKNEVNSTYLSMYNNRCRQFGDIINSEITSGERNTDENSARKNFSNFCLSINETAKGTVRKGMIHPETVSTYSNERVGKSNVNIAQLNRNKLMEKDEHVPIVDKEEGRNTETNLSFKQLLEKMKLDECLLSKLSERERHQLIQHLALNNAEFSELLRTVREAGTPSGLVEGIDGSTSGRSRGNNYGYGYAYGSGSSSRENYVNASTNDGAHLSGKRGTQEGVNKSPPLANVNSKCSIPPSFSGKVHISDETSFYNDMERNRNEHSGKNLLNHMHVEGGQASTNAEQLPDEKKAMDENKKASKNSILNVSKWLSYFSNVTVDDNDDNADRSCNGSGGNAIHSHVIHGETQSGRRDTASGATNDTANEILSKYRAMLKSNVPCDIGENGESIILPPAILDGRKTANNGGSSGKATGNVEKGRGSNYQTSSAFSAQNRMAMNNSIDFRGDSNAMVEVNKLTRNNFQNMSQETDGICGIMEPDARGIKGGKNSAGTVVGTSNSSTGNTSNFGGPEMAATMEVMIKVNKLKGDVWQYKDPAGNVQGPFASELMFYWWFSNYFPHDLPIRFTESMPWVRFNDMFPPGSFPFVLPLTYMKRNCNQSEVELDMYNHQKKNVFPNDDDRIKTMCEKMFSEKSRNMDMDMNSCNAFILNSAYTNKKNYMNNMMYSSHNVYGNDAKLELPFNKEYIEFLKEKKMQLESLILQEKEVELISERRKQISDINMLIEIENHKNLFQKGETNTSNAYITHRKDYLDVNQQMRQERLTEELKEILKINGIPATVPVSTPTTTTTATTGLGMVIPNNVESNTENVTTLYDSNHVRDSLSSVGNFLGESEDRTNIPKNTNDKHSHEKGSYLPREYSYPKENKLTHLGKPVGSTYTNGKDFLFSTDSLSMMNECNDISSDIPYASTEHKLRENSAVADRGEITQFASDIAAEHAMGENFTSVNSSHCGNESDISYESGNEDVNEKSMGDSDGSNDDNNGDCKDDRNKECELEPIVHRNHKLVLEHAEGISERQRGKISMVSDGIMGKQGNESQPLGGGEDDMKDKRVDVTKKQKSAQKKVDEQNTEDYEKDHPKVNMKNSQKENHLGGKQVAQQGGEVGKYINADLVKETEKKSKNKKKKKEREWAKNDGELVQQRKEEREDVEDQSNNQKKGKKESKKVDVVKKQDKKKGIATKTGKDKEKEKLDSHSHGGITNVPQKVETNKDIAKVTTNSIPLKTSTNASPADNTLLQGAPSLQCPGKKKWSITEERKIDKLVDIMKGEKQNVNMKIKIENTKKRLVNNSSSNNVSNKKAGWDVDYNGNDKNSDYMDFPHLTTGSKQMKIKAHNKSTQSKANSKSSSNQVHVDVCSAEKNNVGVNNLKGNNSTIIPGIANLNVANSNGKKTTEKKKWKSESMDTHPSEDNKKFPPISNPTVSKVENNKKKANVPGQKLTDLKQLTNSCKLPLDDSLLNFLKNFKKAEEIYAFLQHSVEDKKKLNQFANEFIKLNNKNSANTSQKKKKKKKR
ncbi:conserved Plasmodium protein, unknown function [Plasmodium ovale curtisi]|uniref:GYF domain-containing protein n=1 Tax=Plasmodium ovale curtisi TaxID=864141 RepID=A0A1A8W0Z3_PLAOA|nr:conserved Plasmodium protein, unknown function [Plasmodium ovale curtisi]